LLVFSVLVLAHLLPVWVFRYQPTQDGPSHLCNAIIVRDYGTPGTHHHEFFELAYEAFPNWTSHLLLAGLTSLVHPLSAEKLLVTGYIVGFAFACRYFLASLPGGAVQLAPLCLLFVYNRCFFMGFYNYCLSLPLVFLILGICARLPERFSPWSLVALAGLFVLAYFTHLVGYVQAAFGAVLLVLCTCGCRWSRFLYVLVALLPSSVFLAYYLTATGFWNGLSSEARFSPDLANVNRDVFIPYEAWSIPIGSFWLLTYGAYAALGLCPWPRRKPVSACPSKRWIPVFILGLTMGILYLAGPDTFGRHGGYLKPRLAIVLPILWLALLRPPSIAWLKCALMVGACVLLAAQLTCTCSHFAAANRILERYAAGIEEVGPSNVLYVLQSKQQTPFEVSYLLHASNYYCLDSTSTNLDNYEATTHYFPVRFRAGILRGRGNRNDFELYTHRATVDRLLAWEWPGRPGAPPNEFREIYRSGALAIYARAD
jgi:hypothetical protein